MPTPSTSPPPCQTAARPGLGLAGVWKLWIVCLLLAAGCEDGGSSNAVDVLGSPDSRFANFDRETWLVPMRSADTANPETMAYDLALLTPRHFMVMVLDGARLREYFDGRGLDIDQKLLGTMAQSVSLKDVRSVVVALDDQMASGLMGGGTGQGWVLQVDFSAAPDQQAWNRWLLGPAAATAADAAAGPLLSTDKTFAIQWRSPTQLWVAAEAELNKLTKGATDNGGSELVSDVLGQNQAALVYFSLRAAPLQQLVEQMSQMAATFGGGNAEVQNLLDTVRSLDKIQFAADLQADDMLRLQLSFLDTNAAKTAQSLLNQSIEQLMAGGIGGDRADGNGLPAPGPGNGAPGLSQELQKLLQEIQAELAQGGMTATVDGRVVDLQATRPRRLDAVIDQSLLGIALVQGQLVQREKLRTLASALQKFYQAHGRYPAESASPLSYQQPDQVATDTSPPFSWRVALLPYLGYQSLHDAFDFSQPWDSPDNRRVAAAMPAVFDWDQIDAAGPEWLVSHPDGGVPLSNFQCLTGSLGALGATPMVTADQIGDGPDRTLMLAHTPQQTHPWSAPGGWEVNTPADLARWQNAPEPPLAVMFSGRVLRISRELPADVLLGWVTANGKERVNRQLINEATLAPPLTAQ